MGFDRSTTAHILALRRIIEGVKSNNLKCVLLFVDFSKAFDSVHRDKMMKILASYGIPSRIVDAISKFYENTKAKVLTAEGETDYFIQYPRGWTTGRYISPIPFRYTLRKEIFARRNFRGRYFRELRVEKMRISRKKFS